MTKILQWVAVVLVAAPCLSAESVITWSEQRESEMPLGVPATDSANKYSGGTPSNARTLWVMADNALRHEFDLFPALSVGPNPSSENPRLPWTNILTPQPAEPGEFAGLFVFSDSTDRGYTFASPATGGCYTLRITDWDANTATVDLRTVTPSHFANGGTNAARQAQLKIREVPGWTSFSVSYSTTTGKVTISATGGIFSMANKPTDASSALFALGFTQASYSGASTYTAEEARFHTDDWLVMRVNPSIFGPPGTDAEFTRWRWLWMAQNSFTGGTYKPRRMGLNLRFETTTDGVVNLDISGVPTDTDIATYFAAVGALLEAANSEGWRLTWLPDQERGFIDQSGSPIGAFEIIITGDSTSAWAGLGFIEEFVIGGGDITADNPPQSDATSERGSMVLYISTTVAGLTEQPDSAFTEGVTMFTISHPAGAIFDGFDSPPSYVGRSSGVQWRRGGSDSQRSRYWVADIADAIGTYLDAPTQIYVKLKIVDPNRTTPISIGALGISAGWWPSVNTESTAFGHVDRSTLAESVGGSMLPTPEMSRKTTAYTFGAQNPLSARDATFLDSLLGAELGGEEAEKWLRGNRHPVFILDPTYVPDEATTGPAKMAAGAAYGFMTWEPLDMGGRLAYGRRTGVLRFVEAR